MVVNCSVHGCMAGGMGNLNEVMIMIHYELMITTYLCHMGSRFAGALAYADDITLLAPCKSALSILVSVSEKYASEFDILFNGS